MVQPPFRRSCEHLACLLDSLGIGLYMDLCWIPGASDGLGHTMADTCGKCHGANLTYNEQTCNIDNKQRTVGPEA